MKYIFISGIPTAGKTHLAKKVANILGISYFSLDDWRDELSADPELKKWIDFFWNLDEEKYWREVTCDQQWENIKNQSEAFWPSFLKKINEIQGTGVPAIFEAVNILPHLAHRDLDFSGVYLLGESYEKVLERNKRDPRWGETELFQEQEAKAIWNCERPKYQEEAEKYGFETFNDPELAEQEIVKILKS
jgi:hypothetical protein